MAASVTEATVPEKTPVASILYADPGSYKQLPRVWSTDTNQASLIAIGVSKKIQVSCT